MTDPSRPEADPKLVESALIHDLNNLITIIQGHASSLARSDLLPPGLQPMVREIAGASEKAILLTRQWSRRKQGQRAAGEPIPAADESIAPSDAPRGNETILIVEDEPALRALAKHILQRQGYHVLLADSGVAAMRLWQEQKPEIDLLITDLVMPEGINGRELAKNLQGFKPELKVLYTSGYTADVLGQDFILEEGVNFLPKPYRPSELSQTIRQALDGVADGPPGGVAPAS